MDLSQDFEFSSRRMEEENQRDRARTRLYSFFRQAELIRGVEPGFAIPTDVRL